ncbi:hypothetical protein [Bradyrhizobium zhanjiangense]|uniref:hypothetical protein n=1 Tax=Bradyrhizobium zhanjiangense TaxID=1325107 RepID=UPI0013E8AC10|nr:hypothetical protein [Bradyrhizobium zhanjiangense]
MSNATRQFARVLHDSVTSEQWFSSSSAMAQHFLIIEKNLADFLTLAVARMRAPSTDSCNAFDGARLTPCRDQQLHLDAPRKRHG